MKRRKILFGIYGVLFIGFLFLVQQFIWSNFAQFKIVSYYFVQKLLSRNDKVLPEEMHERVVIGHSLYELTSQGLDYKGSIYNPAWKNSMLYVVFNPAQKKLYYNSVVAKDNDIPDGELYDLVYRLKLGDPSWHPKPVPYTRDVIMLSISPNGKFMLWRKPKDLYRDLWLLDLQTGKRTKLTDNFIQYSPFEGTVWLDDHQFIYSGVGKENEDIQKLFLFDLRTMQSQDLHLESHMLGAVTPDGKKIALGNNKEVLLYDWVTKSSEVLIPEALDIRHMLWLPDGKGFLYSAGDLMSVYSSAGLYYYSLTQKRAVYLQREMSPVLVGGFILPQGL